ncbi:MAG: H-type lectin domain-containing protein [Bacteroidales bacterium]|nr:H-type lectin domain-containing protein [Candidatus Colimorpha merdihippi]
MRNIEFAKRLLGGDAQSSVTQTTATAFTDSASGAVVVIVGEPLEDLDGNPVPVFDEDGNEVGQDMDNKSEVANIGRVEKDEPVVMAGGIVTGAPGWGDTIPSNIVQDENSITIVADDGTPLATFDTGGIRIFHFGALSLSLYEEGIVGYFNGVEVGRVSFINGVDITPNDRNSMSVHGNSSFDGIVSMPKKIQAGTVSVETVAASNIREVPITFDEQFSEAPAVIVTLESPQTQYIGNCTAYAHNRTSTGFTLRIANNYTNTRDLGASWVAVAK